MLSGVMVAGLEHLADWSRDVSPDRPLILIANHSSWWDAVMPILISLERLNHDAYGVMEERQLKRYGFFRKLGMFSIDREDARSAYRSLEYGAGLIRNTGRVLWLFPQGEIVPNDRRPLRFYSGTARIIRMTGSCSVATVAFRYELLHNERPTAFARIAPPEHFTGIDLPDVNGLNEHLVRMLTRTMDQLREEVVNEQLEEYEPVLKGKRSIDEWWDRIRGMQKEKLNIKNR